MNILDMMNKLAALSEPVNESKDETFTHKGGVKATDEKGVTHKGKYGSEYQGDSDDEELDSGKKKAKKAAKAPAAGEKRGRGRGRPTKGADKDGNVMKPDWSAFGVQKNTKLKPWDKSKTTKHTSLKDWVDRLQAALNEEGQLTATPMMGAQAIKDASGKQVATASTPQAAQAITKGEIQIGGEGDLDEAKNHMGETEYNTYFGWKVASRKAGAKSFTGDRDIDQGLDASGKGVSEWDGVSGSVYDDAHKKGAPEELDERADDRDEWDSNMPGYRGGFGEREREDDEGYANSREEDEAWNRAQAKPVRGPGMNEALIGKNSQMARYTHPDIENKAKKDPADSKYDTAAGRRNTKDDVKAKQEKDKTKKVAEGEKHTAMKKANRSAERVAQGYNSLPNSVPGTGKKISQNFKGTGIKHPVDHKSTNAQNFPEKTAAAAKFKAGYKVGKVSEGRVKELSMDLADKTMKDADFKKKYGETKAEMRASVAKKPADKKPVKESILRESSETLKHIINTFKHEVRNFVNGEEMDDDLYNALYDFYAATGEMPYGTMKARTGDPYQWVAERFDKDVLDHDVPVDESRDESYRPENVPAVYRKQAGQDFPATLDQVKRNSSMSDLSNLKARHAQEKADPWAAPTGDKFFESLDRQLAGLLKEDTKSVKEGMNITTNQGLEGPDSVTISATDDDADQLLSIVRQAGLGVFGGDETEAVATDSEVAPSEPGADIDVVDDHDDMLSLIKKMTGGQTAAPESEAEEEVEEDAAGQFNAQDENSWESDAEQESEQEAEAESDTEEAEEKDEEKLDEAYANDADKAFIADMDFMQNVITGGLNRQKRTQSVGNPVTIAATPLKESTDLLSDYRKLSGM